MRTFPQINKSQWLNFIANWVLLPFLVACVCGDGTRQMGEDCDDGNLDDADDCTSQCKVPPPPHTHTHAHTIKMSKGLGIHCN